MTISKRNFQDIFVEKTQSMHGKPLSQTTEHERFLVLVDLVRDFIGKRWIETNKRYQENQQKQVYYFSIEFLLGRLLKNYLINLGIHDLCDTALHELGIELAELEAQEEDPGLGNGGLGRLAACYLDSMAAMGIPGHGCGIRYKYGLFEQKIINGYQIEYPDNWLKDGVYPWEYRRTNEALEVHFGGNIRIQKRLSTHFIHENYETIVAVPYDVPVLGFNNNVVNTLRLWSAEASVNNQSCGIDFHGDCHKSIDAKQAVENLTNLLYPDDTQYEGKILRLKQQYFLVSAGLQNILRDYLAHNHNLEELPNKIAIHLNDTHPTLAIPELMRLLLDQCNLGWDKAWDITTQTISYTNHTVLPEALETWPVEMFKSLLPRIHMITEEINERFCKQLWTKYPAQWDKIAQMSIIANDQVHMAHLAIVGSHSINGVSHIHTQILEKEVMRNFYELYSNKFNNKTNGVTHRRWLLGSNPKLANLITNTIGPDWINYPCDLSQLKDHATEPAFLENLAAVKRDNKLRLAKFIKEKYYLNLDLDSLFDVQVKRIHAYKRQSLNILHIMNLYTRLKENPELEIVPRTFIFGGKAAASYHLAKSMIKLIDALANKINHDKSIHDMIKVVFISNYNVSLAEIIIPAANVSEQIPTASREASGTANMKFMMNGAITIGTLDGANVDIRDAVGEENIFLFGLNAKEVLTYYQQGGYNPWDIYHNNETIRKTLDQLVNDFFTEGKEAAQFLYDDLLKHNDHFFILKDFAAYLATQERLANTFQDSNRWNLMSLRNIAESGRFSSDRTFSEYSRDIWDAKPLQPLDWSCHVDDNLIYPLTIDGKQEVLSIH